MYVFVVVVIFLNKDFKLYDRNFVPSSKEKKLQIKLRKA